MGRFKFCLLSINNYGIQNKTLVMKLVIRLTIGFAILLSFSVTMAWAWDHSERQQAEIQQSN
jgi:sensor domain CHASE-containing protein